jgi:chloramphenicol 3-O phosphotransferase
VSGKIVLLNGASSSGKSTLARALRDALDEPFWHLSIDHFRDADILPMERLRRGDFAWPPLREPFFDGFHRAVAAFATAGNHLVVEHIVETPAWRDRLLVLLEGIDVFFVGVHCPLAELERRERARGDRRPGDALRDFASIHALVEYDVQVETLRTPAALAGEVLAAWRRRGRPSAFERMRAKHSA